VPGRGDRREQTADRRKAGRADLRAWKGPTLAYVNSKGMPQILLKH